MVERGLTGGQRSSSRPLVDHPICRISEAVVLSLTHWSETAHAVRARMRALGAQVLAAVLPEGGAESEDLAHDALLRLAPLARHRS